MIGMGAINMVINVLMALKHVMACAVVYFLILNLNALAPFVMSKLKFSKNYLNNLQD